MRRSSVGKGKSARKFKARAGRTAGINRSSPLRGGIRL